MGIFDFFSRKKKDIPEFKKEQALPEKDAREDENLSALLEKVEVVPGLFLARAFADHWPELEKTKMQFVSIEAVPAEDIALEQSKLGHYPCMPVDFEYPKDAEGHVMYPLAQINFKELPPLEGYPTSGYLQFYVSGSDDIYGLDFDDRQSQKNFRVLFFEEHEVEKYKADFSFLDQVMETNTSPVYKPQVLNFTLKEEYVGVGDVRYEDSEGWKLDTIYEKYPEHEDDLSNEAYDSFDHRGSKIGGYAGFAQEDPRIGNPPFDEYVVLLQIDSTDDVMWGDSGVGSFFIHPDDLAKRDFSKVMYSWDCH